MTIWHYIIDIYVRIVLLIDEEEEDDDDEGKNTNTDGIFSFFPQIFFLVGRCRKEKSYRAEHSLMSFVNSLSLSRSLFLALSFLFLFSLFC